MMMMTMMVMMAMMMMLSRPPVMVMFEGSMVDLSSLLARVRRADSTLQLTEKRMSELQVSGVTDPVRIPAGAQPQSGSDSGLPVCRSIRC